MSDTHVESPREAQDAPPLPDDLSACHALIVELVSSLNGLTNCRQKLAEENDELKLTIESLLLRLKGHRRERFEDPNQLKLDFNDPATQEALADAVDEAERVVIEYQVRRTLNKPKRPRNEQLPPHLPRVEVEVKVPDEVANCPEHGPRKRIGEDRLETLVFERPKLWVRVTVIPKFACEKSSACGVKEPERPQGLVEGNRFDTSVAAEILTAKSAYHLPIYRQQDWFAGSGWMPRRSTLLNIQEVAAEVLKPLAEHFHRLVLQCPVIGTDETRVTLLLPSAIPEANAEDPRSQRIQEVIAKAKQEGDPSVSARMWAYRPVDFPVNVFDFTVSRHRDGPDEFLKDYTGKLIADCYTGYENIELRSDSRIQHGACWAHARRKVFDGRDGSPLEAAVLLAMIQELYDVEDRGRTMSPEDRRELRQLESQPVLSRMRAWLDGDTAARVLPKSQLGKALGYLRNQWAALQVYLSEGRMPIDNNDVEQLMKQVAVGRKNWLFIGSVAAGYRAATILTIVSTAHRNDLDVWAYLKDVLDQLLAGSTDYRSLQADVWKQAHPEHIRTYRAEERRDRAEAKHSRRARRRQPRHATGEPP
jgi:transposase